MSGRVGDGMAGAPPGPELGMRLAVLDPRAATDDELLDLLTAQSRQLSHQQAQLWRVLAELATRDPMPNLPAGTRWSPEQIFESAVDEVRAELRLTRRSARRELEHAEAVVKLPQVLEALSDGTIDRTRAIVLANGCSDLTEEHRCALLHDVLPEASQQTATELADSVRRVALALDPGWAERRYKQAVRERRVIGYLNDDGSATVSGQYLPAEQAAAACARVDALADTAKRAGAAAAIDHLRAELFLGLLDGRFHGMSEPAIVAELRTLFPPLNGTSRESLPDDAGFDVADGIARGVHVRVRLATLLERIDEPGEIAGWGPVPASVARRAVAGQPRAEWRFAIVDENGQLLFDGVTRRRPRGMRAGTGVATPGGRGIAGPVRSGAAAMRGVVELHVPADLLDDPTVAGRHPEWAGVLADLRDQSRRQRQIENDARVRFPGRPLRRRTQTFFQRCTFPGCRRAATDCDIDHRRDYARGGRTDEANLAPACRHDHNLKTSYGWRLARRTTTTFVWISPRGRRHVVTIDPVAPPLPAPLSAPLSLLPCAQQPVLDTQRRRAEPTFTSLTQRGRIPAAAAQAAAVQAAAAQPAGRTVDEATVAAVEPVARSGTDPPPF